MQNRLPFCRSENAEMTAMMHGPKIILFSCRHETHDRLT